MQRSKAPPVDLAIMQFIPSAEFIAVTGNNTAIRGPDAVNAALLIGRMPLVSMVIKFHVSNICVVLVIGCQQTVNHALYKAFPARGVDHCGIYFRHFHRFLAGQIFQQEFSCHKANHIVHRDGVHSS